MSSVFKNTTELSQTGQRWVLALGTFDGVHLGHRAVLRELLAMAQELAAQPAVLFFDPLPRQVLHPEAPPKLLTSPAERIRLMEAHGVSSVVELPFDLAMAALPPAVFLQKYFFDLKGFKLAGLCCGEGWRFGAGNAGDAELLRQLAAPHGIRLRTVPPVIHGDEKISSSRIRQAVADGDLELAEKLLGRPYSIAGTVSHGAGIASTRLQTPTANLVDERLQLPPYGVYAARTDLDERHALPGIVYIGDAPTLRGNATHPVVELHLFDFQGDIYARELRVTPVKFLRESRLFPSPEALQRQIQCDLAAARQALSPTA